MNDITAALSSSVDDFITHHSYEIDWNHKSSPEKWCAVEILGHLTDSAIVNLHRFVRCTFDDDFTLTYAQNQWVSAQHYKDADVTELLALWKSINIRIVTILGRFPPHRLHAKCNNLTVDHLASDYVVHMRHHLDQIIALRNKV